MSLSKESQEYHLTPRGWETGTFKGDVIGGFDEVATPKDRALTVVCYDKRSSAYSEPDFHSTLTWESEDKQLVNQLKAKWGERPDWFGFSK